MLDNDYMDTSVQKGGVPGVPGCLEHTSVLSKIIEDAKRNHGDLAVLWLVLTNAYGTIPHKLVETTLKTYHVPERFQKCLQCYFNRLQALIRAFMDNLTITAKSVPERTWSSSQIGQGWSSNLGRWHVQNHPLFSVPWEERMQEAHEHKLKKYQTLIFESQQNGWIAWNLPVNVGCRGFAGQLLWVLGLLGIEGPARKQAEVASWWIWIKRNEQWHSQPGDGLTTS